MKFKDKVVLVTGASRGIGRATALFFGKQGAVVIVNYLNSKEKALKVVENIEKLGGKSIAFKCDISIEKDVLNMITEVIKKYSRIDILVNNAGISNDVPILERTAEQWKRTMDVNLLGTFLCSKYVIIEMKKTGGGKIVNLSSVNGTKHFYPEQVDYDVSKAGIITLTKELAKAAGPNIYVNAVAPGNIDNMDEDEGPTGDPTQDELSTIYSENFGKITEVSKTILFLSGDDSSHINGTTLFVDGGCD